MRYATASRRGLVGGRQPAEPLRHRPRAADDGAYVAGGLGRAPQHRPRVVRGRFGERPPDGPGECGDAGGGDTVQAAPLDDQVGGRADAFDGPPVHGGSEAGGPAHLDGELIELRGPDLFGEQQRLLGQDGDRDAVQSGEPVTGGDQDPQRVLPEQQRRHLRRGERGPADADVQAAVGQLLVLLGHAGLDLMDDQARVAGLDLVQNLRHRVVAGVDDADPQRGGRAGRAAGDRGGSVHVG